MRSAREDDQTPVAYEKRHETNTILEKAPAKRPEEIEKGINDMLRRAEFLGYAPDPADTILDFGCGIGHSVNYLLRRRSLNVFGVDVYEFWGSENQHYYEKSDKPDAEIAARLFKLHPPDFKIPFPDDHFDFVFSDQVFEHILDNGPAFAEIKRVLKPSGMSLNIFPGPWKVREPHIGLPLIPLCHSRWYLTLWALLGRRTKRQKNLRWRETVAANLDTMRFCHYPSERQLKADAKKAGVDISFKQADWLRQADSRVAGIIKVAQRFGIAGFLARMLSNLTQRMMIIKGT